MGGPEDACNKVKPLFELMGKNITLVGDNGDGQTCKVANQIIVALNIEAVGEALLFASKRGYVMWTPSLCSSEDLSTPGRVPEKL